MRIPSVVEIEGPGKPSPLALHQRTLHLPWSLPNFAAMNFRSFFLPLLGLAVLSSSGCAVHMAATQPTAKPTGLFHDGTSKEQLVANFGAPTSTVVRGGTTFDIYTFENGSHGSTKFLKCLFYGICDVGTLGITEVIFTPLESALRKRDKAYEVSYDPNGDVNSVKVLRW